MIKRAKQLILACLIPVLILLGMTVTPLYTLVAGEEVILPTQPVDPTDVFRGDYVVLSYEAEEIPSELLEKEVLKKMKSGSYDLQVYVSIKETNGLHVPTSVSLTKPSDRLYLKGKLRYVGVDGSIEDGSEYAFIEYSLDKYFVEENTGANWEEASSKGKVLAKVKVKNGYAILTDIMQK